MRRLGLVAVLLASGAYPQSILDRQTTAERRYRAFWTRIGKTDAAMFQAVARLRITKPVDDLQASLLGRAYFRTHFGACGGASRPVDKGHCWSCETAIGYGGDPGPEIRIDKRTGATYVRGGHQVLPESYRAVLGKRGR